MEHRAIAQRTTMKRMLRHLFSLFQRAPAPVGGDTPRIEDIAAAERALVLGDEARQMQQGRRAEIQYRDALRLYPGFAAAHCNLGSLLRDQGSLSAAEHHLEAALRLDAACAPAAFSLALIRIDQKRWTDAASLLESAVRGSPDPARTYYWLGNARMGEGHQKAAISAYKKSLELDGHHVAPRWALVMAQLPAIAESAASHRAATKKFAAELGEFQHWLLRKGKGKGWQVIGAQQPYYLAYIAGNHRNLMSIYGRHCSTEMATWHSTHTAPVDRSPNTSNAIRVGIVSAHICSHSVWHALTRGWLDDFANCGIEVHIFHVGQQVDRETQFAQRIAHKFHHAVGDWPVLVKTIAESALDIVLYPEIGMDTSTLRAAALRLAPVQIASWGHPITTGLPTIDYYVTASAFEPPDGAQHYTERLLTLPGVGCCYRPFGIQATDIELHRWNIRADERLLICPGTPMKYAPQHDHVWLAIARLCAPCKLIFFRPENSVLAVLLENRLRRFFLDNGANLDDSVRFVPWQAQAAFFALLDKAVAVLDTLDFSGFNTAMQAVERGTPLVAFEGLQMRGRFASGIMREMGMEDLIATEIDGFIQIAQRLVSDSDFRHSATERINARRDSLYAEASTATQLGKHLMSICRSQPHRQ